MNINKTMIAGRLTRDPEVRYTPKGTAVADIGLAVNERVKEGEEWKDKPTFIDVTLWGQNAENVGKYLSQGSLLFVEGRLQQETWEDKETGQKRSKMKVVGQFVQFGPKSEGSSQGNKETAPTGGDEDIPF